MKKISSIKSVYALTALFTATYFISYLMRMNFAAVISEMVSATGLAKSALSPALTGFAVTYGAGQVVSGFFGDRFSPKKLVAAGIGVSALCNLALPFFSSPALISAVWWINGFSQAFFWPPMVRMMTEQFGADGYKKYSVFVTYGSAAGSVAVYLLSPLLLRVSGYRLIFTVSGACGLLLLPAWLLLCPAASQRETPVSDTKGRRKVNAARLFSLLFTPLLLAIMGAIALQGMLKDGVMAWMPSLLRETFSMDGASAIASGVALPLMGLISLQITAFLYRKVLKNPLLCAAVIFSVGCASALGLWLLHDKSALFTVAFTALLIAAMQGVNLMLTCMVPPFFEKTGMVSTISGVLNAFSYVGIALSTTLIAVLSDAGGWAVTLLVLFLIACAGTALCFLCVRPWAKIEKEKDQEK